MNNLARPYQMQCDSTLYFLQMCCIVQEVGIGNSLVVQWLGLRTVTAAGLCSIPGQGTKIPQAESRHLIINFFLKNLLGLSCVRKINFNFNFVIV